MPSLNAVYVTVKHVAENILRDGIKQNSYWFPESVFRKEWELVSVVNKTISILLPLKYTKTEPYTLIRCELNSLDTAEVEDLTSKYRRPVSLDNYISNNLRFEAPRILVKNEIKPSRIVDLGLLEHFLKSQS